MDSSDVRCATGICTRTSVVNINISDIMDEVSSTGGLFADDCVIYREVSHRRDAEELQRDLEKISNWTKTWQLALNIEKCQSKQKDNNQV